MKRTFLSIGIGLAFVGLSANPLSVEWRRMAAQTEEEAKHV